MNKKIFIIEDDANVLYGLQSKMKILGFDVENDNGSSDIEEIIDKIKNFKPNFLILDILLPSKSGFDVLKMIKSDTETRLTTVYIYTNLSDQDTKNYSFKLGAEGFIIKNEINFDELSEKIKKILFNKDKIK
jgi:DNA-binding response OmpR family regulator